MNDLEKRRWDHLLSWLKIEHGMDVGEHGFHVEARDVTGAGRGLFASRDCPPGTTLFKVPSTALMNRTTLAKLYPRLRKLSATQLISLHLLLHKPSGDDDSLDPAFGPYISTLPREFSSHPLTWMVKQKLRQETEWERGTLVLLPPGSARKCAELHTRFWKDWKALLPVLDETAHSQSSRPDLSSASFGIENNAALVLDYLWSWLNGLYFVISSLYRRLMDTPQSTRDAFSTVSGLTGLIQTTSLSVPYWTLPTTATAALIYSLSSTQRSGERWKKDRLSTSSSSDLLRVPSPGGKSYIFSTGTILTASCSLSTAS
ncbi:hypothetical protein GSI_13679 [Ganoderma sinense ZZ0214-1]|uniref:Uncharacterized protein n=1 Tax=Ganoderma sinense ZZ0214-1 TaxID=1077348 RepID=A0A2G8RRG2_9APHY|nr:hypothetical protein GSI_13679 [Ganoderma sinense ZZ0214-1]